MLYLKPDLVKKDKGNIIDQTQHNLVMRVIFFYLQIACIASFF